ncbi:hypothetical protein ACLB2K_042264 [Fragaria x ananassa]
MADQKDQSDGDVLKEQAMASTKAADSTNNKHGGTDKSKEDATNNRIPYYKLFSFADIMDYLYMSVGTISAIGNGLCMPLMTVIMGEVINSFGDTISIKWSV